MSKSIFAIALSIPLCLALTACANIEPIDQDDSAEFIAAAHDDLNEGDHTDTPPADYAAFSVDPLGKRAGAWCGEQYMGNPNQPGVVAQYCARCCADLMGSNPDIHQWNVCIRDCNRRAKGEPLVAVSAAKSPVVLDSP